MGRDVAAVSPAARQVFETADAVLGEGLTRLCFNGPEEELTRTANAQPAILVASIAILAAAIEAGTLDRRPAYVAGHSLGQYTALVAAGSLSFEAALLLVRERGRYMEDAGREQPGAMAAVVGLSEEDVEALCRDAGAEPCNYNSPTQLVIGGTPEAVERACGLARERGGRGLPLNVSGAFHTSLMRSAAGRFATVLEAATILDPAVPVVGNVSGAALASAEAVAADLKEQVLRPVRWRQSVEFMAVNGVSTFVEAGPGRVLTAMLKRAAPELNAISIDGAAALANPANV
jgi:[acyl-carrier-protein] S-malonyltransferase